MAGVLQGKLVGVKVNGSYIRCQTDATLTITTNVTDDDPCKPTETDTTNSASWVTHSIDTKAWTVSVTAKAFADTVAGLLDNSDIAALMITGDPSVEMTFQTIQTTDYDYASIFVYEGTGTLISFTHNAPVAGESTYDLEITGNGALTFEETPVTT
jgi:hypothetical protein